MSEILIDSNVILDLFEQALAECAFKMLSIPKPALFLAGKAYIKYKQRKGSKNSPLPDFYIGAHAAISQLKLITRDTSRYRSYFPDIELISPK